MLTTRTAPRVLTTSRLDPDYYAPIHLQDEERLRSFGCFDLGACGRFFVGPFGSELPGSLYRTTGIPLLRVSNVGSLDLVEDNLVFLDELDHKKLSASEVIPGDLLIVKASVGEKVCRFPSRFARGNITQHIIGVRPSGHADMDYVAAVLFSPIGRRQLARRSLGSIIQYLGVVDARSVLIPSVAPLAQRYIGDKVRQAERLRARAQRLEGAARRAVALLVRSRGDADSAMGELKSVLGGATPFEFRANEQAARGSTLQSRVSSDLLLGRLNAEAYQEEFLDNDRILRASGWTLKPLGELVMAPINNSIRGVTEHLTGNHQGVPMFRPADIEGLWMSESSAPRVDALFEQEHAKARVLPGDIVLAIAGTVAAAGRIGETVSYGNINGSSARIRIGGPLRGFALFFFESIYGRRSLMRQAVGSVQKHLNLEDLPDVRIPVPEPGYCTPFEQVLVLSGRARHHAADLITAATQLVEGLINGTISEREVVHAASSMDAKTPPADAALLRQLKDPISKRLLFPDMDALVAAISEADAKVGGGD